MTEQELEQMEANEDGNHPCPKCGVETSNWRAVELKVMTCKECTRQKSPPKALYVSNEREGEGGFEVIFTDDRAFREARRALDEADGEEIIAGTAETGEETIPEE